MIVDAFRSSKVFLPVTVLVLSFVLGACGGDDEVKAPATERTEAGGAPVTGEFVGKVDGRNDFLVAVVAEGTGTDRRVRLYVCSRTEDIGEWLASPAEGNSAALTSPGGAVKAEVTLTADRANGTLTLGGGTLLRFEASRPRGIGGLYDVNISPDGKLTGKDALSGATTEGQLVSRDPTGAKPFVYPVRQSYTAPGGQSVQVKSGGTQLGTGPATCIVVDPDGNPQTPDAVAIGKATKGTGFWCDISW